MTTHAHYSIHYQALRLSHLQPGRRQRHFKGRLLLVHQGSGLVQLGRQSFPLASGEGAFLPADTLFAWHGFAGTRLSQVDFSPRLSQPGQAGRFQPSPLLAAIAGKLADWQDQPDWQGPYGRLCRALYDELPAQALLPFDALDPLMASMVAEPSGFALEPGQQEAFRHRFGCDADSWRRQATLLQLLRELPRSSDWEGLLARHGFASLPQFEQDCRHWLGAPCHPGAKTG
jgi:hypothetical protein